MDEIFAWVCKLPKPDDSGAEYGICAFSAPNPDGSSSWYPMVFSGRAMAISPDVRKAAEKMCNVHEQRLQLIRFTRGEVMDEVQPVSRN